jgi:hypothetical protein
MSPRKNAAAAPKSLKDDEAPPKRVKAYVPISPPARPVDLESAKVMLREMAEASREVDAAIEEAMAQPEPPPPGAIGKWSPNLIGAGLLGAIENWREDPANLREHNVRSIEALRQSLERFGQQKPIVVDPEGVIVAGNGTFRAAQQLGWTHLLAVGTDLEGNAARAYGIADNRSGEHAVWLYEELSETLRRFQEAGEPIDTLGWADWELEPLLRAEWHPPEAGVMPEGVPSPAAQPDPVRFTADQWVTVSRAIEKVRADTSDAVTSERALELICADYLA